MFRHPVTIFGDGYQFKIVDKRYKACEEKAFCVEIRRDMELIPKTVVEPANGSFLKGIGEAFERK